MWNGKKAKTLGACNSNDKLDPRILWIFHTLCALEALLCLILINDEYHSGDEGWKMHVKDPDSAIRLQMRQFDISNGIPFFDKVEDKIR